MRERFFSAGNVPAVHAKRYRGVVGVSTPAAL